MPQISQKQLAEIIGVSSARITAVRKTGRLDGTYKADNKNVLYDQDAAGAAWNGEIQQSITRKNGSEEEIPSFNESRAKSEHFRAELARIDLELREEKLCELDKVQRQAFSMARSVRDALNRIPDRVANQFAAETDSVVIHKVLSDELRKALERLTDA